MDRGLFVIFVSVALLGTCGSKPVDKPPDHPMYNKNNQEKYLKQFGYMKNNGVEATDDALTAAICKFQEKWDLQVTCEVNEETVALMETPRCGMSDENTIESNSERSKRFVIGPGGGWGKTDLTYHIVNASSNSVTEAQSYDALERALLEWSNITPLTFTESSEDTADLVIFFVSRAHADGYPFDGSSNVLAHAFYPAYGGDAHFDDDENWTLNAGGTGIDLFIVGVHEFGHSLGLDHSRTRGAVMYPYYAYQSNFALDSDDIAGIQALYGVNEATTAPPGGPTTAPPGGPTTAPPGGPTTAPPGGPTTAPPGGPTTPSAPVTTPPPSPCTYTDLDAITLDRSGLAFIFKGTDYAKADSNGILPGFPQPVTSAFPELTGAIDAALYLPKIVEVQCVPKKNGGEKCSPVTYADVVFLFSGTKYYRYGRGLIRSQNMKRSGQIRDVFPGLPASLTKVDAAFTYNGNDVYFIIGDSFWKYTRSTDTMDSNSPQTVADDLVTGLPTPLSGAYTIPSSSTSYTYFFVGDQYYRTSDGGQEVDTVSPPYPRSVTEWWC